MGFGGFVRRLAGKVMSALPAQAPMWIYKTILRLPPLRAAAHAILRRIIPPSITLPEGVLLLNADDPIVSGALSIGTYEPGAVACWRGLLREDQNVLDIGANIGLYTLIAATRAKRGSVVAFEPGTENAALLRATVERNGCNNVVVVQAAAGAVSGAGRLNLDRDNKGLHSLVPFPSATGTEQVRLVRVDDVVEELRLGPVHLIKIDIEGWEAQAFRGMRGLLAANHPIVLFEFMPQWIRDAGDDPREMLVDLRSRGYALFTVGEGDGRREVLSDDEGFMRRFRARDDYVNLLAVPADP